jgi:hypothetical protein
MVHKVSSISQKELGHPFSALLPLLICQQNPLPVSTKTVRRARRGSVYSGFQKEEGSTDATAR